MNKYIFRTTDDLQTKRFFHGTRADLKPGDLIKPGNPLNAGEKDKIVSCVFLTPNLDGAIWDAEIADGEGPGRVYIVEPLSQVQDIYNLTGKQSPGHPSMSYCSTEPVRVIGEFTEWLLYHGTKADLKQGDLIKPGLTPNFGNKDRRTNFVYLTRTIDAATWGAELSFGEGPGRIYIVEPTGPIEDDPNLTDKKFRGNPTKSFRSRDPLLVKGELKDWQGHPPDVLKAMKDGLERLAQSGVEPIDE